MSVIKVLTITNGTQATDYDIGANAGNIDYNDEPLTNKLGDLDNSIDDLGRGISGLTTRVSDLETYKTNTLIPGMTKLGEINPGTNIAQLDANGKVPSNQLPSYVDDCVEGYYRESDGKFYKEKYNYEEKTPEVGDNPKELGWYEYNSSLERYILTNDESVIEGKSYFERLTTINYTSVITPEFGKIYMDLDTNKTYRWGGTAYVPIGSDLALGYTHETAFYGDEGGAIKALIQASSASDSNKLLTENDMTFTAQDFENMWNGTYSNNG